MSQRPASVFIRMITAPFHGHPDIDASRKPLAPADRACEAVQPEAMGIANRVEDYGSMRRALLLLAKATTSILLLYLSLHWVNVGALGERLSWFEWGWVALALFLLTAQVVLVAARWREIATVCGANLAFISALQINFIATFFNQVLPSTVGGDSARIWLFARKGAGWASATYSVLIDRIAGVFVLALIVITCLPWTLLSHSRFDRARGPVDDRIWHDRGCIDIRVDRRAVSPVARSMDAHPAFVGCFTDQRSAVSVPPIRHDCLRVLGRDPFAHRRRSVVLRQSGRRAGQFRASSVPHAAGAFDRDRAGIDRRLGRP